MLMLSNSVRFPAVFISFLLLMPAATQAQVSFEFIGSFLATDVSADGSVVVGNTVGNYETFRWTSKDGFVPLGMATVPVLGTGAGTPDVSADGTRISATILGEDLTYATQGLWTLGSGWQECQPMPSDSTNIDQSIASAWGLSGDGNTLVGLYWRSQPGGSAHPSRWTQSTGVVDLGTQGGGTCTHCGSGRANDVNYDGSVVAGWIENPNNGTWWPTVWVNGVRTTLKDTEGFAEADGVSSDGTIVVGSSWFAPVVASSTEEAAVWRWNGNQWVEQRIGKLLGTAAPFGTAIAGSVTADGSMIVGYNRFGAGNETGFVWTQETGMIDVVQYLTSQGVTLPPDFDIQVLSAISADGSVIVGIGQYTFPPYEYQTFKIDRCALKGDMNKDSTVDGLDIAGFVRAKLGQVPDAGENSICANYGGTLEEDVAAFTADLLGS
jgi:uncharacterized membrane protein